MVSDCFLMLTDRFFRGEDFRADYGHLGEVRSLLPTTVKVMALTATANQVSRTKTIESLRMETPKLIYKSPHKKNIFYCVRQKPAIEEVVYTLSRALEELKSPMLRTIIFLGAMLSVLGCMAFLLCFRTISQ